MSASRVTHSLGRRAIRLLEEDPDLGRTLPARDHREALELAVAPVVLLTAGTSGLAGRLPAESGALGWLILDGLIIREVTVGDAGARELLGPGDLLRPRDLVTDEELVRHDVETEVMAETRLACLDRSFTSLAGRWPELMAAVMDRASRRAVRLSLHQAISHLTRVDQRLLVALWLVAERWGRVTGNGVLLTVKPSHRTLARLIGAQRPTVTKALRDLAERGLIERHAGGEILLAATTDDRLVDYAQLTRTAGAKAPKAADDDDARGQSEAELHELRSRALELDRLNEFLEAVLTSIGVGVVVLDREQRVLVWNASSEAMWGLRSDEVLGRRFRDLQIGLPVARLSPWIRAALKGGSSREVVTAEFPKRRGVAVSCEVRCMPLDSRDGSPGGAILLLERSEPVS